MRIKISKKIKKKKKNLDKTKEQILNENKRF